LFGARDHEGVDVRSATATAADVVQLPTGEQIELHTMDPDDAQGLLEFHRRLSSETIYLRFFTAHPELSARELDRFTHVDHLDREAVVASSQGQIVAVGRYDRRPGAHDAEVAFVVTDGWQGHGLGTTLLGRLADLARSRGIDRFTAETLATNRKMLEVFRHSGLPMSTTLTDGVVHVTLELEQ
jgi:GNAT superfamily N-acetyltransferase